MSQRKLQTGERPDNAPDTIFPNPNIQCDKFGFGFEAEFLLVDKDFKPLWYKDVTFNGLNEVLESISLQGIEGDFSCLEVEAPHRKRMPYIVEGYHIPDDDFNMVDMYPKGLEIRTPVCKSIEECIATYKELFLRLQTALQPLSIKLVNLSHHPMEFEFSGPVNKRRYDFWQWAMQVMTTYGPDINVSVPSKYLQNFRLKDFESKVNYYSAAMAALSLNSPFFKGEVWKHDGEQTGLSYRTHKRSIIAPAIEYHADENNRFEFKVFEMSPHTQDIQCYFLLFLALLFDDSLPGRADKPQRIYQMGEVARYGLKAPGVAERAGEIVASAKRVLPEYGFETQALERMVQRIETRTTLADEVIDQYSQHHSLPKALEFLEGVR